MLRSRASVPAVAADLDEPSDAIEMRKAVFALSVTSGRVDWSPSVYRGFEPLPLYEIVGPLMPGALPTVIERFPRFTMMGGDFETVRGEWGVRGEIAASSSGACRRSSQPMSSTAARSKVALASIGQRGPYRISGNVLVGRRWQSAAPTSSPPRRSSIDSDVNLVASIDRHSCARPDVCAPLPSTIPARTALSPG